jgi:prepilin-type N-terminal cleavage/methylation domain-containing protein
MICRKESVMRRQAFSLVELLVVITIMLVLMGLMGAALSNARNSQKRQETQGLIAKLDAVIQQQFASYAGRDVPAASPAARAVELRRQVTGDLPDRWVDVKFMADNAAQFTSPHQRAYIAVWNSFPATRRDPTSASFVGTQYAGAECLFMIVMRGGVANCLDCGDLAGSSIGDKDGDGAFEFWDAWDRPIGYILWPGDLQLPADSGTKFFSNSPPFASGATGRTLRPLIYSAGADGTDQGTPETGDFGFRCTAGTRTIDQGAKCGDPSQAPTNTFGTPAAGASDNLTNYDAEVKQ